MRGPRVYVAGPVTGVPCLNRPAFEAARTALADAGYRVLVPHDLVRDPETPWRAAMRVTIAAMMRCDAVAALEGWDASKGARLEVALAKALGIKVDTVAAYERAAAERRTNEQHK